MRKILLRPALTLLLAVTVAAQSAPSVEAPRNEVTLSLGESRDLASLRAELETASQRYTGNHPQILDLRAKIQAAERNEPWLLSFEFAGGPLKEFLDMMGRRTEISFNIISASDPQDLNTPLPPFALHNASLPTVFEVVKSLLGPHGFSLAFAGNGDRNSNSITCVLTPNAPPSAPKPLGPAPTVFDSFLLAPYLAFQSIDEITATIREGWELDPAHDKNALRLKYHPGTSILLVSGSPEAISIAHKIILTFKSKPGQDPDAKEKSPPAETKPASKE